jgi:hypothetical protein
VLPCVGREPSVSLSPVEADSRAVMQANMRFRVPDRWSILLTFEKLRDGLAAPRTSLPFKRMTPALAFGGWVCAGVIWGERRWSGQRRSAASRSHPTWRRWSLLLTSEIKPAVAATLPAVMPGSARALAMVTRWHSASSSRGYLVERLPQRLRGEWLGEIGEAPGLKRRRANGRAVVPSHVDDRH